MLADRRLLLERAVRRSRQVGIEGCERVRSSAARQLHPTEDDPRRHRLAGGGLALDEVSIELLCSHVVAAAARGVRTLEEERGVFVNLRLCHRTRRRLANRLRVGA